MIWRSNITVWNSHDVLLLLLFTSTLGVIIEVNIFYTNTITRGLSLLRWDLSPSSKHLHWWFCSSDVRGMKGLDLVGICVCPGEENLLFIYQLGGGGYFKYLEYWSVRFPNCILFLVKFKCDDSCCRQWRWTPGFVDRKDVFGVWDCKGGCFEHHNIVLANLKKINTLSEVRNALDAKMKV